MSIKLIQSVEEIQWKRNKKDKSSMCIDVQKHEVETIIYMTTAPIHFSGAHKVLALWKLWVS